MSVITASEFIQRSGVVVEIRGFREGETIEVKLKNVSVLGLVKGGRLPNGLLKSVAKIFGDAGSEDKIDDIRLNGGDSKYIMEVLNSGDFENKINQISDFTEVICREAMLEPRYDEVKEYMSQEQMEDITNWVFSGGKNLPTFR